MPGPSPGMTSLCCLWIAVWQRRPRLRLRSPQHAWAHREPPPWPVPRREEQPGGEGEMTDEGAELGLIPLPVRRAVKGEPEEHDIGGGEQRRFAEVGAGEE